MARYARAPAAPARRGMLELDKSAFATTMKVLAARVPPANVHKFMNEGLMKREILDIPKVASVVRDPTEGGATRLVLLGCPTEDALPPDTRKYISENSLGLTTHDLVFDYDYWGADEIMRAVLPEEMMRDSPSSFTITGHIAHFNLRDQYLPYKHLIGQVVLDKNKRLRTVVNKLGTIDTEFRYFKMEVLAGDDDFNVVLHESDCIFEFDFSTVYWNSRLQNEHIRLIEQFQPGQVVADVCAGVGPFAVPAAKRGCFVLGNDLNPKCAEAMEGNATRNKVDQWLRVTCQDGREFIRRAVTEVFDNPFPSRPVKLQKSPSQKAKSKKLPSQVEASSAASAPVAVPPPPPPPPIPSRNRIDHFVMNLPATAIEFLDAFRGIFRSNPQLASAYEAEGGKMPMVHVYSFTKELDPAKAREDLLERGSRYLGTAISEDVNCHWVRTVAPNKDMYCLSFRLPRSIGGQE